MPDIVDTAVAAGSFNTLVAAVTAAGLVDTLKVPGPFTVFAPSDDAFAKLPAGTVDDLVKPETSAAMTLPDSTCRVRILVSLSLFSGLTRSSTVPAGSLAKASSLGAKTVNGPGPFSVSTRPAAVTAATRVLNEPAATAVSTISGMGIPRVTRSNGKLPRDGGKTGDRTRQPSRHGRCERHMSLCRWSLCQLSRPCPPTSRAIRAPPRPAACPAHAPSLPSLGSARA